MSPKAQEEAVKRKKIRMLFGLIIILTLAFAIKKIYFKPSALDKKLETISFEESKPSSIMMDQRS